MSHRFDTQRNSCLFITILSLAILHLSPVMSWSDDPTPEQVEFFEKKIRPILSDHCYECHAADKQESDLRLDSREALIMGGASGKAVNLDDPESSLILEVLNYGGDIEMPPDQKLADEKIDDLKKWIEMGVPWPKEKKDSDTKQLPLTMADRVKAHRQKHWAYQAVQRPDFSFKDKDGWSRNGIDLLVKEKLADKGIAPSAEADRYTLTRRLYLNLLGIPPTFEEVQRVVKDRSPTWYENLVDRLQASPRYGERWGRHWMDVARYADTRGYSFQRDRNYPHAYTYRDYVIDSLNDDKPYDRFIKEQLAADQLELGDDLRPLAALGFLTVGRKFNNVHDDVDDKIDVVFRGLQGLTVACARCHDHKYDAIPTADYYSLYGVFVSSREGDLPYIGRRDEVEAFKQQRTQFDQVERKLNDFLRQQKNAIADRARLNSTAYFAKLIVGRDSSQFDQLDFVGLKSGDLVPKIERAWRDYVRNKAKDDHPVWAPWKSLTALGTRSSFAQEALAIIKRWEATPKKINPLLLVELKSNPPQKPVEIAKIYGKVFTDVYRAWKKAGANDSGLAKLSEAQRQIGIALFTDRTPTVITDKSVPAYLSAAARKQHQELKTQVAEARQQLPKELDRAMVVKDIARPVQPFVFIRGQAGRRGKNVPRQFIEVLSAESRQPFVKGAGRLELADLITSTSNPLTARVIANRVWMHLMGESLVETPSDFGQRCAEPIQKDVLDLLASELIDRQWSIKRLQRMIVLSATYRQASDHREKAFQLDAANTLYWKANRQRLEFEPLRDSMLFASGELDLTMNGKSVQLTKRPFQKRRGVYGYVDRQDLPNLFRAFDFASPDQSSAKRTRTTVPQQMLFMMNSPFVIERAYQIASRLPAGLSPTQQIDSTYKLLFARVPSEAERDIALKFVQQQAGNDQRIRNLAQLLLLTNEFTFVD